MSATFAIDRGLPKVTLNGGLELWLGLQAVIAFVGDDGRKRRVWLPMPFWGFGRRIRSSAVSLKKDSQGRTGISTLDLLERMKQEQATCEDVDSACAASFAMVEQGRHQAEGLPGHYRAFYISQLEAFLAGVGPAHSEQQPGDDTIAA